MPHILQTGLRISQTRSEGRRATRADPKRLPCTVSALHALVHRHLARAPRGGPTTAIVGPEAAQCGAQACALAGAGLDLFRGEHTIAAVRMHMEPQGVQHLVVLALTNTRLVLGGYASIKAKRNALGAAMPYDAITQVTFEKSFLKGASLELHSAAGPMSLKEVYLDALGELCRELGAVPIGSRGVPGVEAVRPAPDDPSGAMTARNELWAADPAIGDALERVHGAVSRGAFDAAVGQDLVGRAVLAHRALLQGPGAFADGFACAHRAAALPGVVAQLLGAPIGGQQGPDGTHTIDFGVPRGEGGSRALAALGIASFIGLGVGLSPGRMIAGQIMAKPPLNAIRLVARDGPGATYYALFNPSSGQPLHREEAMWAHGIHQVIAHHGPGAVLHRLHALSV